MCKKSAKFQSRFAYVIRQNEAGAKGPQQKIWFFAFFECSHTIEQLLFSSLGQEVFLPGCMFRPTVVLRNFASYQSTRYHNPDEQGLFV